MELLKPVWVNHDDKPIFSVDIHPTGKRFATGGQGSFSGRVVVWNLSPVLCESVEMDPNVPKMLCQMDNHLACVNCVRWSNNGKYLASCGDDRLVMVWGLSVAMRPAAKHKAESWRCLFTLRGHAGDVLDLAWSPQDKWLASCSVDNTIIVWNAEKFPEMVCVLNGHTGFVKGVAWDPVGKYLASQSDDKSLVVWKTSNWTKEKHITEPFEECSGTTHVLRLSWSPDGQYVLSAHAMNGGGSTAQVVEREDWRTDKDFVGHRKAVTCSRFNNNILVKEGKKCCCAAVGSRDRALSIWLTSLKRPLVVIHELFDDSVLDLSWSSDGLILLACSSDGTVACIQFTNKHVGTPLTLEEKNAFYEKIYGPCLANETGGDLLNLLVESPDVMIAREKLEAKKDPPKEESTPKSDKSQSKLPLTPSPVTSAGAPLRPMDRQIETRTSDGKRRITPVFIPLTQSDANDSLGSHPSGAENCFSTSSQGKSRIRVERRDDIVIHPNVSNHATLSQNNRLNETGLDSRLRKHTAATLPGPSVEEVQAKRRCTSPPEGAPAQAHPQPHPHIYHTPLPAPALGTAGPVVRAAGAYRLQVLNNACNTYYGKLSRLQLIPNNSVSNNPVWETYLGAAVTCVACDARWASCAAADGSLHAWRLAHAPSRALPPVALVSPAAKLVLSGDNLAVVCTSAELVIWDLATASCVLRPLSFRNLVTPGAIVTNCALLQDGNPMISLSSGKTFIYSQKLCAWVVWADGSDPVRRAGGGTGARAPRPPAGCAPPPAPPAPAPAPPAPSAPLQPVKHGASYAGAARSWLEAQVAASEHLRLPRDYRHWVCALAAHLLHAGLERPLRALLDALLGPAHPRAHPHPHPHAAHSTWVPTVLGIKKHDILEELLALLVKHYRWQRLYTEYAEQMKDLKEAQSSMMNGH